MKNVFQIKPLNSPCLMTIISEPILQLQPTSALGPVFIFKTPVSLILDTEQEGECFDYKMMCVFCVSINNFYSRKNSLFFNFNSFSGNKKTIYCCYLG